MAAALREAGLATLLLDLLTPNEERNRANVFDIPLLASRLSFAADWSLAAPETAHLPIGYFGASTGAGAALVAAAARSPVRAIVSRGGRPDLAGNALPRVTAPTLLIVGSLDTEVIELNRMAHDRLSAPKELVIVPGAGHLFEEPGTLDAVEHHAIRWFRRYLAGDLARSSRRRRSLTCRFSGALFDDRRDAGRLLAAALARYRDSDPVVLALPRGGVPVGFEVAKALGAPLDVLIVRKIGAPGHPELGIGAVIDGSEPHLVLNEEVIRQVRPPPAISKRKNGASWPRSSDGGGAISGIGPPSRSTGRTAIVVDDGIATGGTVRAALRGIARCIRHAWCWRCRSRLPTASPSWPAIATISCAWPPRAVLRGRGALPRFHADRGRRGHPAVGRGAGLVAGRYPADIAAAYHDAGEPPRCRHGARSVPEGCRRCSRKRRLRRPTSRGRRFAMSRTATALARPARRRSRDPRG